MKERVSNKTKQTIFTDLAVKGKMKKFFFLISSISVEVLDTRKMR